MPAPLHVIARSPRQAVNSPGVQETAMQVSGSPESAPSTSQKGRAGSVQVPSRHDFGFGLVQPDTSAATRRLTLHQDMVRCSEIMDGLSTGSGTSCVESAISWRAGVRCGNAFRNR